MLLAMIKLYKVCINIVFILFTVSSGFGSIPGLSFDLCASFMKNSFHVITSSLAGPG